MDDLTNAYAAEGQSALIKQQMQTEQDKSNDKIHYDMENPDSTNSYKGKGSMAANSH